MKFVFIINPVAGKGRFQKELPAKITSVCSRLKIHAETYETKAIGDALLFVKNYPGTESVSFYAVGGDGTLNEVVNGAMLRGNAKVGILPCGSGNDFIRLFPCQNEFLDVESQIKGSPQPMDVIKCNNSYAINICNMGADAQIAADVHRYTKIIPGSLAYSASILNRLLHKLGFDIKVTLDNGEVIEGTYMLSTFANGIAYGGGYYSAPKAKYDDNLMDICLIRPMSLLKISKLLKVYKLGGHLDDPRFKDILIYRRSTTAVIETTKPQELCIDGEIVSLTKAELKIVPHGIEFILPKGVKMNPNHTINS